MDETLIFWKFDLICIDQSHDTENNLDQKRAYHKHKKSQEQNVIEFTYVVIDP